MRFKIDLSKYPTSQAMRVKQKQAAKESQEIISNMLLGVTLDQIVEEATQRAKFGVSFTAYTFDGSTEALRVDIEESLKMLGYKVTYRQKPFDEPFETIKISWDADQGD